MPPFQVAFPSLALPSDGGLRASGNELGQRESLCVLIAHVVSKVAAIVDDVQLRGWHETVVGLCKNWRHLLVAVAMPDVDVPGLLSR